MLFVKEHDADEWMELGRTETIMDCLSPAWVHSFALKCATQPQRELQIRAVVYDNDDRQSDDLSAHDLIGECVVRWGDVLDNEDGVLEVELESSRRRQSGRISFQWEDIRAESPSSISFQFEYSAHVSKAVYRSFFIISRSLGGGSWTPVYRSETIQVNTRFYARQRECARAFEKLSLSTRDLCAGVGAKPLRVQVFNHGGPSGHHTMLSEAFFTLDTLKKRKPPSILQAHRDAADPDAADPDAPVTNTSNVVTPVLVLHDKMVDALNSVCFVIRMLHF